MPTLRQKRAALVRELVDQGHALDEAARRAGISPRYAKELLSDPDGATVRARRRGYARCRDCGGPVDGSGGRRGAPERCRPCSLAKRRAETAWPPERVIAALRAWVAEHGRAPTVSELGAASGLPSYSTLLARFGTAADAFTAAGIEPREPGRRVQR
jgi:Homing endonuclease associated repeat